MIIHVTRDSVCMGDDVFDNSRDIEFIDPNAEVKYIIPTLLANSFFPFVSGNDVMWTVVNAYHETVVEYYTKWNRKVYHIGKNSRIKDACGNELSLHCVYHSSYK